MSYFPRIRRTTEQVLAGRLGSRSDWLPAWQTHVRRSQADPTARNALIPELPEKICDTQNLMVAFEHLRAGGGDAPGPDGVKLEDFTLGRAGEVCRVLSDALESGRYRTAQPRRVKMSKGPGRGDRTLSIFNAWDRVVHRAIQQIVQPVLDSTFQPFSLGGRPGKSCLHALLALEYRAVHRGLNWIALDDLRDAFDHVPRGRLLNVLLRAIPNPAVVDQIEATWSYQQCRHGIAQGSPLSSLMLNLYLNHFIDRRWADRDADVQLLRYVDDFLLLGRTANEVNNAHQTLVRQLQVAGLAVKRATEPALDLTTGVPCEWLGFAITWQSGELVYGLPHDWFENFGQSLMDCHFRSDPSGVAFASILGWARAYGPVWKSVDSAFTYRQISRLASEYGFAEIPSADEFGRVCRKALRKWRTLQRKFMTEVNQAADLPASARSLRTRPTSTCHTGTWHLVTDGACLVDSGVGGCAFELTSNANRRQSAAFAARRTTNNRAELKAVILGLKRVLTGATVQLTTDSSYVADAVNGGLEQWEANHWRGKDGRPLKNLDLLRELAEELHRCQVRAVRVKGHSGHLANERVDRAANHAAQSLLGRLLRDASRSAPAS